MLHPHNIMILFYFIHIENILYIFHITVYHISTQSRDDVNSFSIPQRDKPVPENIILYTHSFIYYVITLLQ